MRCFPDGLSEPLKDHLAPLHILADLETVINLVSKIDKRLIEHQRLGSQQDHFRFALA